MKKFTKVLLVLTLIAVLVVPASLFSFAAEATVPTAWGNTNFEDHHTPEGVWYVMNTSDEACWKAIGKDRENNNYSVTIDGKTYAVTTTSVYDGDTWGYLRFYLGDTDFVAVVGSTYQVTWTVEAKDGSWAYTSGDPIEASFNCTNSDHDHTVDPTPDPEPTPDPVDPPKTGDVVVIATLLSVVSLAGTAFVSKKRR